MSQLVGVRSWLAWLILSIWIMTSLGVLIAWSVHPATEAKATLTVSEISFTTDAPRLLGPTEDREVVTSGLSSLEVQGSSIKVSRSNAAQQTLQGLRIRGDRSSTCAFYRVRRGGIFASGPSRVALVWNRKSQRLPLGVESDRPASLLLTSQPGKSGLTCTGVRLDGGGTTETLNVIFSESGNDSISVVTSEDSRIDIEPEPGSQIQSSQIPILTAIRFAHVDPGGTVEESVLEPSNRGQSNQVNFTTVSKSVNLDDKDLFILRPRPGFYMKALWLDTGGIHLVLEGLLEDSQKGPGAKRLKTIMPSMLDHLQNEKGVFALVPSLVALIVGILEKMGVIPKNDK